MENFLGKVREATTSLGKAPFDDSKTEAVIRESTHKVIEEYYAKHGMDELLEALTEEDRENLLKVLNGENTEENFKKVLQNLRGHLLD